MLTIVYPKSDEAEELALMNEVAGPFVAATVDLFINDQQPGLNSVDADFDIPTNVQFPGYATSAAVVFGATPVNLPNGHPALLGGQKNFIASDVPPAPLLVYGYILKGSGTRRQYVRFSEPKLIANEGDYVAVDPFLVVGSQQFNPATGA